MWDLPFVPNFLAGVGFKKILKFTFILKDVWCVLNTMVDYTPGNTSRPTVRDLDEYPVIYLSSPFPEFRVISRGVFKYFVMIKHLTISLEAPQTGLMYAFVKTRLLLINSYVVLPK